MNQYFPSFVGDYRQSFGNWHGGSGHHGGWYGPWHGHWHNPYFHHHHHHHPHYHPHYWGFFGIPFGWGGPGWGYGSNFSN